MTELLPEQGRSRRGSDARGISRHWLRGAFALWLVAGLIGCGGDAAKTSTTSNEDIAAFIEENPEYGDSSPAAGTPARPSEPKPLGLER